MATMRTKIDRLTSLIGETTAALRSAREVGLAVTVPDELRLAAIALYKEVVETGHGAPRSDRRREIAMTSDMVDRAIEYLSGPQSSIRPLVLDAFHPGETLAPAEVSDRLQRQHVDVSRQRVHNSLTSLVESGEIEKIGPSQYRRRPVQKGRDDGGST